MLQITIKKNEITTNQAHFNTQEELDVWLSFHKQNNSFGVNEYSYENILEPEIPAVLDEEGNELSPEVPAVVETIHVPAEYTIEIEDISAQIEEEAQRELDKQLGQLIREKCEAALDIVIGFNARRELSFEQVDEMQSQFAEILGALQARRIDKATMLLMSTEPDGTLVTQEMLNRVLAELAM